ncbi:MAG: ABC transporter permease [Chloroflexaceae bacterium]|nr:ABC transporter permease [Chloroflexaceae bacterium]
MIGPRWKKVLRDLGGNKTRTILVVLSIAVGVFAVGVIATSRVMLSEGLDRSYQAINPASAMIMVSDPFFGSGGVGFGDELVEVVRGMDGVEEAEGRRKATVRLKVGPDEWRDLQLFAIPDYEDIRINKVSSEDGSWPPEDHELLIERSAMGLVGARVGDTLTIKTPNGKLREMPLAGISHDLSQLPSFLDGTIYGYTTFDTLEWLGEPRNYNELYIVVAEGKDDKEHIQRIANQVKEKVERSGRPVYYMVVPEPGEHVLDYLIQAIVFLLGVLGILALFLSSFLVVTTISAILTQHVRQIGLLKAIGARRPQIMQMYLTLSLTFGILAMVVAVPLSAVAANGLSSFMAGLFNFDIDDFTLQPQVVMLQAAISLLVPVLAALYPVIVGTRISVREALDTEGGPGSYGRGLFDRLIRKVRGVSRPLLLSLRNTFRRKGRLMLTLTTLTLSGTMFISVFCIRDSMFQTLEELMDVWQYDLWITLSRPYRIELIEHHSIGVPGVVDAQSTGFITSRRVRPDDTDSDVLMLFALQPGSKLMKPIVVEGRWLLPGDENGIVLTTAFVKDEEDIEVGSNITLNIAGNEQIWRVVGICQMLWPAGYVNYPHYSRVKGETGRANTVWVVTDRHDAQSQATIARRLEQHYEQQGIRVSSVTKMAEERAEAAMTFNIIVMMLAMMAVLLAVVGGLGLMGTMSINVLERTREIGVMRAIGASNGAVMNLVLVEGILIGMVSWLLSALIAVPLSKPLSASVGIALFQVPLSYAFSIDGLLIWLSVVVVLSAVASLLPAWNASRLTVRDVLAYE